MKNFFIFLICLILLPPLARPQEKKSLIEKTGEAVGKVTHKITDPIKDPKAMFSYWFDFDPRIERGEKKNFNVLPLFVSSPERGQGFGLKFAQESLWRKSDIIRLHLIQTLKSKSAYQLNYQLPPTLFEKMGGEIKLAYENYSRFYYGIGNNSSKEDESEYTPELFEVGLPLLYGITETVSLGFILNFQNWNIVEMSRSGILRQELPQLRGTDGSKIYSSTLMTRWDTRNSKTNPSKGIFLEGNIEYAKHLKANESDFTGTTFETRGFIPVLGREDHIFAVRMFMDYKNGAIPFYRFPELGGIFFNRGLIEGRFRNKLSLTGNWEYRLKIYQRLHWAFFVDAGNVYGEFNSVSFSRTKITGGTGMRYYVPPGNLLLARVDGGYSTEGLQIYLTFDHPF